MIELDRIRKNYGAVEALGGITTRIERGEIVGLLGPNGAGKTTAMKILVGYLLPTSGAARVDGIDVVENPLAVQGRIGYLPENDPVYVDMLVQEYLQFIASMRGLAGSAATTAILKAAGQCAVTDVLTRPIGHLSKGYRQRVGLAGAILHDPPILILDEPTTGLDPNQIVEVRDLIRHMGRTKTVILSTHILPEVEASCSRAVILIDGQIRADGTLNELTQTRTQIVSLAAEPGEATGVLERIDGVSEVTHDGASDGFHTYRLQLADDRQIGQQVFECVRERGWSLRELRRDDRTLEQVFRELTETSAEVLA